MRKLASIQRVTALTPIKGADRIEVARVQGWDVVVQKGLYETGDLVVYFEIDSILPEKPWCEFLRDRKFRVKTIKLRKQVSQGLCVPIEECFGKDMTFGEGVDVTATLGVTKHDPAAAKERAAFVSGRQHVPHAWMMRFSLTRKLHQMIYPTKKGSWPEWFPKTDETRIQNLPHNGANLYRDTEMYVTEKLDGQSFTAFYKRDEKVGLFKRGLFGVCSRNIWYKNKAANNWWNIAEDENLEDMLPCLCDNTNRSLAIQGEICGPGIQGNPYQLEEKELFIFNVYDIENHRYLSIDEKSYVCDQLGLSEVPRLSFHHFEEDFDFVKFAEGESTLFKVQREGVVIRQVQDDGVSFKAISNKHLLKKGE